MPKYGDSEPLADDFLPFNSGSAIIHKESGFVFPAEVASFKRECEMTTDLTGDNFQIRYAQDVGKQKIEVNIAVYQDILDGEKDGVLWHFSLSTLGDGYWHARLIVSYPHEIDPIAQEALLKLITAFQWQTPKR